MARTAPVPDIPPIPGMCPSIAVLAGGGDGGGGSGGDSGDGNGDNNADGSGSGEGAEGDQRDAPSPAAACGGSGGCTGPHGGASGSASRGDPVDVVTGRAFTLPVVDLALPGPLPLLLLRSYSSGSHARDCGLGFGWSHSLAWEVFVSRRAVQLWKDDGTMVSFGAIDVGRGAVGPDGLVLVREAAELVLDAGNGTWLVFSPLGSPGADARRYVLTAVRDRYENRITLRYEGERLDEIVDSAGRVVRVTSTSDGRIASFAVKNAAEQGQWVAFATYTYDKAGNLTAATDADGYVTSYTYGEDHLLASYTHPSGLSFFFRYDSQRRCVETWGSYPGGKDPSLASSIPVYLADHTTRAKGIFHCKLEFYEGGYSEVVDSVTVQRFFGNKFGKLDKAVSGGAVFTRRYDEHGHLLSYTDPRGGTTQWERDGRGREIKITDPLGRATMVNRDPDGHVREVVDAAGGITYVNRSREGLTWTDPIGATFSVMTDERGLTRETIAPNGSRTRYRHDAHGNLIEKVTDQGATTRLAYDYLGRCSSLCDPTGAVTSHVHSNRGDLVAVRYPDGGVVRYTYDGARNLTSQTNPDGGVVTFTYGGLDKLCAIRRPNGDTTELKYNREGRLVQIHNEKGEIHEFELNTAGLVVQERHFDGRIRTYQYDACGDLVKMKNGLGEKLSWVRDLAGQIIERKYCDDSADTFSYDALGAVVAMTSAGGEFSYERNAIGWITRETQTVDGESHDVERTCDLMGNVVRRSTSLGHTAEWTRDAGGRSPRVLLDGTDEVITAFDVLGREVSRSLPRGGRIETKYDIMGRRARRRVISPSRHVGVGPSEPSWIGPEETGITVDQAYSYSAASELMEVWDKAQGIRRFEYDPAGQLLAIVPESGRAERFRYDAAGNLFNAEGNAEPRVYGPGNRLLRRGDTEYVWDGDGRLQEKRTRTGSAPEEVVTYKWSPAGLLRAIHRADGVRIEFAYDPFARRVMKRLFKPGKSTPTETTRFVWDGTDLIHEIKRTSLERGDPVVEERTYCFDDGGDVPWAHRDAQRRGQERVAAEWVHYLNDDIGMPERLVGSDGEVVCELSSTAWGKGSIGVGAKTTTALRFPGQYSDEETGLSYNRYRYYDADAGRYISADPIGIWGGLNGFAYADNRPTAVIDPSGLFPDAVIVDPARRGGPIGGSSGAAPVQDPAVRDAVARARRGVTGVPPDRNCAEHAALHQMASEIRAADRTLAADTPANNAEVQRRMRERFRNGATIQAPGMHPCPLCGQVFRELGIHPSNINAEGETPATGGVLGPTGAPWDGRTTQTGPTARPTGGRGGGRGGRRR